MTQIAIPVEIGKLCERCRSRPGVHQHHRQLKSQGGGDEPENLVLLCLDCHRWVHDNPRDAAAAGWIVLSWQKPEDVDYQIPDPPPVAVELRDHTHTELTPGETCPVCHRKVPAKREKPETPRNRAVVSMKVPKDKQEDGAALWDEMIELGRELLCERLGWQPDVPTYNVAMVLVAQGLESIRAGDLQEKMGFFVEKLDAE